MRPMWLCIFRCAQFEDTFENTQWRKDQQMQPVRLCVPSGRRFEETFENSQWGKVKQMQPVWICIISGRQFVVSCPTRWSLFCSLALCIDHLVGGGNPIWAAVKYSDHCWGLDWSIWTNFFAKCKFYICSHGVKKFWCIFQVFLPPKLVVF